MLTSRECKEYVLKTAYCHLLMCLPFFHCFINGGMLGMNLYKMNEELKAFQSMQSMEMP